MEEDEYIGEAIGSIVERIVRRALQSADRALIEAPVLQDRCIDKRSWKVDGDISAEFPREVQNGELSMQFDCKGIPCDSGFVGCGKRSGRMGFLVENNGAEEAKTDASFLNSDKSGLRAGRLSVHHVLSPARQAQIGPPIIQWVAVYVINQKAIGRGHDYRMHVYSGAVPRAAYVSKSIDRVMRFQLHETRRPLVNTYGREVPIVNQRDVAPRQRNFDRHPHPHELAPSTGSTPGPYVGDGKENPLPVDWESRIAEFCAGSWDNCDKATSQSRVFNRAFSLERLPCTC